MNEVELGIFIAFTAGIFSFLSPCVWPLVPSYLSLVTGMSLEDLQEGVNRRATFILRRLRRLVDGIRRCPDNPETTVYTIGFLRKRSSGKKQSSASYTW